MSQNQPILSVSRLVSLLQEVVEDNFVHILVEGEIANCSSPASGHLYFSLKDERSNLRAVMFRTQNRLLAFRPDNGMKVLCTGRASVYPQRGELQFVVERMEPCGVGSLQLAFEQLKERLADEGLFAQERKRPIPPFPQTVGVVTSATGAAIHDILNVLRRRSFGARVLLFPARVQGEGSALEIARGIAELNREGSADVLIVGRGGGGIEDLWSFNEEEVARAIFDSEIPVISAVGHEVDTTIADLVADLRAPTPSAAAELVAKSRLELENHVDQLVLRLTGQMSGRLRRLEEKVAGLRSALRSPTQQLALGRQRYGELCRRMEQAEAMRLGEQRHRLANLGTRLDALSPLKVLARGYSLAFAERDGRLVRDASELTPGDRIKVRFARGSARALVEEVEE